MNEPTPTDRVLFPWVDARPKDGLLRWVCPGCGIEAVCFFDAPNEFTHTCANHGCFGTCKEKYNVRRT